MRLKNSLAKAFPDAKIATHSAGGKTGKIEVAWIESGQKKIVWSKGKADTENNHAAIAANLKPAL